MDAELARLRAENDALRARLDAAPPDADAIAAVHTARSVRRRAVTSIVFVVLGALLLPMAAATLWTRNQLLDTDRYVRTVAPLAEDPTLTSALSARITSAVAEELDVKSLAAEVLPERAAFLAAPIASGAENLIRQATTRLVESRQFRRLWVEANRRGHDALVAVVTGEDGKVVSTKDGKVVISLGPIVEEVLKAVDQQFGIDISSRIPTDRIDVDFEIIDSRQLAEAQTYVRLLDRISWFSVLLALGFLIAAVAIAPDRRKGVLRVGIGVTLSMLLTLIAMAFARDMYLTNLPDFVQRADAAAVIYDTLVRFFIQALRVLLAIGVVLLAGAWLAGPSAPARRLRGWWDALLGRGGSGIGNTVDLGPVPAFVARHLGVFRAVILIIAALTLVTWNLPTGKVVLLIALCTLIPLALVQLLAGAGRTELEAASSATLVAAPDAHPEPGQ
ncbi:MAG: hypothetical protein M3Y51_01865 [Actinomycetota bacterium]|nr:hypothetical protein [Actinomycetota bacterium]